MEARDVLNELVAKRNKEEDPEKWPGLDTQIEEQRSKVKGLTGKYSEALEEEERAKDGTEPASDQETAKYLDLRSKVKLGDFLNAAAEGRVVDGIAEEYRDHVLGKNLEMRGAGGVTGNTMPIDLLDTGRHRSLEKRNRVTLAGEDRTINDASNEAARNITVDPVLARVFAPTMAAFLYAEMMSVPTGVRNVPVFATGASEEDAADTAKGSAVATVATTFTSETVEPNRLQASYSWAYEDEAVIDSLEMLQRDDLSMVLGSKLDNFFFRKMLADANIATVDRTGTKLDIASQATSWPFAVGSVAALVDGIYAQERSETRMVLPLQIYNRLAAIFNQTDVAALDYMENVSGGVRGTPRLAYAAATGVGNGLAGRARHEGAIVPIWNAIRFIRDEVTQAANGQVVLTAVMLVGHATRRPAKYAKINFDDKT